MRLDLSRPRDVGAILSDAFGLYFRHFRTFVALSAAVVVPAEIAVSGIGLEQISASYDSTPGAREVIAPVLVSFLVVTPLVAAMTIHALLEAAEGTKPVAKRSIAAGFDAFTNVFMVIVLAALAVFGAAFPGAVLGAISVPVGAVAAVAGVAYVGVRLYFVVQCAIIERHRGIAALRRSWELSERSWWRILGVGLLVGLAAILPAQLIATPFEAVASSSDRAVFSLAGSIVAQTLSAPLLVIGATLLYFDIGVRRAGYAPPPIAPPPPGGTPPPLPGYEEPSEDAPPPVAPPDPPGLPPRD